jgi:hypothetical protein
MVKYLITYSGMGHPDPAQMEAARAAFGEWLATAGDAVVDPGSPVNYIGAVAAGTPTAPPEFSGYTIIEAETEQEVRDILANHPFVARGGTLQISQSL